ncbi:MAG: hypothetical protein KL787_08645 [Taibaiella sp.]|nr:hypothetical protein [Taibaiella sp.]
MKRLFFLFLFIPLIHAVPSGAQRKVDLRIVSKTLNLRANDSQFIISGEGVSDTFRITKQANERNFKLVNEQDKDVISSIMIIDKDEIKEKFEGPFPKIDAIDKMINLTAATPEGVILTPSEDGGRTARQEEIGGQAPGSRDETESINWKHTAIALLIGIMIGAVIVAVAKRRPPLEEEAPSAVKNDEEPNFEETIAQVKDDPKKILDAAKEKISKLQAEKKQLQTDRKQMKYELEQLQDKLNQNAQFNKTYYGHIMKEIINPMNAALEKGDQARAVEQLLKMAAHFTSITRHELGMKQAYDSVNIASILKQQSIPQANIETVNAQTPPDRIPVHIRNVMELMRANGTNTLDNAVIFGYKIHS